MQLIRPGVEMLDPIKQKPIGPAEVMEKFGVTPDKMVEVQALIGDSIDNVPGVPGIGPKGAAQLIDEFGDLEAVLAAAPAMKPSKRRDMLIEHADKARHVPRAGARCATTRRCRCRWTRWWCASRDRAKLAAWLQRAGLPQHAARLGLEERAPACRRRRGRGRRARRSARRAAARLG